MIPSAAGTVYNLLVLDESFSMEIVREPTIKGFNELVHALQGLAREFPQRKQLVSLTTFNGLGIRELVQWQDATLLQPLTLAEYRPTSMTPLHDALGQSLSKLRQVLATTGATDYQVLVTVLTDGEENASKQYSRSMIRQLIEQLTAQGWTFVYIGANHDVAQAAEGLAIGNRLTFTQNSAQMEAMFEQERAARRRYNLTPRDGFVSGSPRVNYFADEASIPPSPDASRP
jgi:Mg-chelatase subunit ChlD